MIVKLKIKHYMLLVLFFTTLITSMWGNNIYILFSVAVASILFTPSRKGWDATAVLLLSFSILYNLISYTNGRGFGSGFLFLTLLIAPLGMYKFGQWVLLWLKDEKKRITFLYFTVLLYLLPLFSATAQDIAIVGFVNPARVFFLDMLNDEGLAATLYGLMSSVGIGFIALLFVRSITLKKRLIYILLSILSMIVVIHLVNRTGLVIFGVCTVFAAAYYTGMKMSKILPVIFLVLLLGVIIFYSGIINDDVIGAYSYRTDNETYGTNDLGGRTERWTLAIEDMMENPFGWNSTYHAHNLWLDIAKFGGWPTFIVFVIATITFLRRAIYLVRRKATTFSLLALTMLLSMTMNAAVEPVIEGSMLFFSLYIMMWGVITALYNECKCDCKIRR